MKHLKQQFLTLLFLAASLSIFAQVGVGTTTPEGALDVVSANSGLIVPRVANTAAVTSPVDGMVIYDISSTCTKAYENSAWSDCLSGAGATASSVINNCDQNGFEGAYVGAVALGVANDFTVTITNNSFSTTAISLNASDLVLSGTGLGTATVASVSPTSLSLTAGQSQQLTYQLSGTPVNGTLQADWTKLYLSCTKTLSVTNGDATFSLPQTVSVFSVYDGTPVVDIAGVVDNATNQLTFNVPYTSGIGSYNAYTSGVITNASGTGEGGDANGFTISYPAGTFAASGSIPVTITVDGDGSFSVKKQLFGAIATIATLDFKVNGNSKGNVLLDAIGGVTDREYGDGIHDFVYFPVTSPTGEVWLNHNLGAAYADTNHASFSPTQQATASNDHLAYGSLYQWGRYSDGHELINWTSATAGTPVNGTTATLSVSDTPANSLYITPSSTPYDWRSPQNDNLWQGAAGANNPCPSGYRLPTDTELNAERATWGSTDAAGALASPLKLPASGLRFVTTGSFSDVGVEGSYWSSTVSSVVARYLRFDSSVATMSTNNRARGYSVRCIKD